MGMDSPYMYETGGAIDEISKVDNTVNTPNNNNTPTNNNNNNNKKQGSVVNPRGTDNNNYHLFDEDSVPDLADLDSSEISLELTRLIDDSQFAQDSSGLFGPDCLSNRLILGVAPRSTLSYMPQPVHNQSGNSFGTSSEGAIAIKQEPVDASEFSTCRQRNGHTLQLAQPNNSNPQTGYNNNNNSNNNHPQSGRLIGLQSACGSGGSGYSDLGQSSNSVPDILKATDDSRKALPPSKSLHGGGIGHSHSHSHSHKLHKKNVDKASDEYRRRRERNNIAVRKSREKAKQRSKDTEHKVKELQRENENLQNRISTLTKELNALRSVYVSAGLPAGHLEREISKFDLHNMQ